MAGLERTVQLVPKLPWLLSLLKTTASLAGRLARIVLIEMAIVTASSVAVRITGVPEWIKSPMGAGLSIAN